MSKQVDLSKMGFYSNIERVVEAKMPNKAHPNAVGNLLRSHGIGEDEITWSGANHFLNQRQNETAISKSEFLKHIRENLPQVRMHAQGDPVASVKPTGENTSYRKYTVPGHEAYREVFLTTPSHEEQHKLPEGWSVKGSGKAKSFLGNEIAIGQGGLRSALVDPHGISRIANFQESATPDSLYALHMKDSSPEDFKGGHWGDPNILAHLRLTDRTDKEGKKALHIEEVQSDWHQKGRDEGYREDHRPIVSRLHTLQEQLRELNAALLKKHGTLPWDNVNGTINRDLPGGDDPDMERFMRLHEQVNSMRSRLSDKNDPFLSSMVPAAPFSGKHWPQLAMKAAMRLAAEGGYDKLTWSTGEQQADHYNLAKHVDALEYHPYANKLVGWHGGRSVFETEVPADKLEAHIGKNLHERLMHEDNYTDLSDEDYEGNPYRNGVYSLDMAEAPETIGGDGMKRFYGSIHPETGAQTHGIIGTYMNDYAKKWGGRVGVAHVPIDHSAVNMERRGYTRTVRRESADYDLMQRGGWQEAGPTAIHAAVHALEITPQMREGLLKNGQPLWGNRDALQKSLLLIVRGYRLQKARRLQPLRSLRKLRVLRRAS